MDEPRYLCSQLVTLSRESTSTIANLEEISRTAAILECEEPVPEGTSVSVRWDEVLLSGRVSRTTEHEFGWRVEMTISPLTPWSPELARPAHLLDIVKF